MKVIALALILLAAATVRADEPAPITFHAQLIRGTDDDGPPVPGAHPIGPKLDRRLRNIFKWKHYWEIKREDMELAPGGSARKQMSQQRDVEIKWPGGKAIVISIYTDGKVTRKQQQPVENTFYIAGGDKDATASWFIIVRRDTPEANLAESATP